MKILHALASYEIGGGEMMALRLARWQHRQGHQVHVVALSGAGPLREHFATEAITTHLVPKGAGFDLSLYWRLAELLARLRPRIVHTHNPQSLVYVAPPARALLRKVVHTKHGEAADSGRRFWLRRGAGALTQGFVSVSAETERFARRHHEALPWLHEVIENGVEVARYAPQPELRRQTRAALGADEQTFVIGTVGRLQPVKNHELLVEAAAPLLGPKTLLVIAGDGPELAAIEARAQRLGVSEHVRLLGYRADIQALMGAFDTFAMSSRTEGLPLVLLEAMASALPVVSTEVGGIAKVVRHGEYGLLVPEGDAKALGAALAIVREDRLRGEAMGAAGRAAVSQRYSIDAMAERYMALYQRI